MAARIDHAVVSGTFSLDGETHEVDNNVWVVGDDAECVVIDAPHSVSEILALVGDRTVRAILCTHAHDDHVRVAPALREEVRAPIMLHPADQDHLVDAARHPYLSFAEFPILAQHGCTAPSRAKTCPRICFEAHT
jgi:glyoxylase-like metal-dependent hydrolase (beta-lactamase superfamily II)